LAATDPAAALAALEAGLAVARAAGNRLFEALIFAEIAGLQARYGDPIDALTTFLQMLVVWRGTTELLIVSSGLANLVVLLDRLEYSTAAATLLGSFSNGMDFSAFAPELAAAAGNLKTALGETAFDAANQHGAGMNLEDVVAFGEDQVRRALAERSGRE
jgi:hypothetical protein